METFFLLTNGEKMCPVPYFFQRSCLKLAEGYFSERIPHIVAWIFSLGSSSSHRPGGLPLHSAQDTWEPHLCVFAPRGTSEAGWTVVDQQAPVTGNRTDFIQHFSFFTVNDGSYHKLSLIGVAIASLAWPFSSWRHREGPYSWSRTLAVCCRSAQCPSSNCWFSFLGIKWECFRREWNFKWRCSLRLQRLHGGGRRFALLRVHRLKELDLDLNSISFFGAVYGSQQSVYLWDSGVCTFIFDLCRHLHLAAKQLAVRNDTVCMTPVTRTLPTERNFVFWMSTKFQMAFDHESSECSCESHEVLYGSVALDCVSAAFLAEISENHQPFDTSYQTAQEAGSQGPATLPRLRTGHLSSVFASFQDILVRLSSLDSLPLREEFWQ